MNNQRNKDGCENTSGIECRDDVMMCGARPSMLDDESGSKGRWRARERARTLHSIKGQLGDELVTPLEKGFLAETRR
ncbi:Hypothetical predicted protein, partial [Pelobates cultripes]